MEYNSEAIIVCNGNAFEAYFYMFYAIIISIHKLSLGVGYVTETEVGLNVKTGAFKKYSVYCND